MRPSRKVLTLPLRILSIAVLLGVAMKILAWPMATEIMFLSFSTVGLLYCYRFWKKPSKQFMDYNKLVLVSFWALNGIFSLLDLPFTIVFQAIIAISFVLWFILEGVNYFIRGNQKTKNRSMLLLWNLAMVFGTLAIIAGSLLKILDWEYAISLLAMGIAIVCAYIFKDSFTGNGLQNDESNNGEYQL